MYADPDPQVLRMFAIGESDGVILKPRPSDSKADQFGAFWCDTTICLSYRKHSTLCKARGLVEQELMNPIRGAKRNSVHVTVVGTGPGLVLMRCHLL